MNKDQAKALAIRYHAFRESSKNGDKEERIMWAKMLYETQEETGVRLHSHGVLLAAMED